MAGCCRWQDDCRLVAMLCVCHDARRTSAVRGSKLLVLVALLRVQFRGSAQTCPEAALAPRAFETLQRYAAPRSACEFVCSRIFANLPLERDRAIGDEATSARSYGRHSARRWLTLSLDDNWSVSGYRLCLSVVMLSGINHVSFSVRCVETSKRFYTQILGFHEIKRPDAFDFDGCWCVFCHHGGVAFPRALAMTCPLGIAPALVKPFGQRLRQHRNEKYR